MPQIVQTGMSSAINFLSGFGKGMVQADVNRRENEKLNIQKQKWQQEMTAYAAQDEFRRLQMENSRLEIDMRKTQFADLKATKEQTKGFTAYMFNAISNTKGKPAEKQSMLFEAYTGGAAQFPMADMSMGDKLIDTYAKIHTASAPKAWKIIDMKDYDTGKKTRTIIDENGDPIKTIQGEENLDIVNDIVDKTRQEYNDELDLRLQTFLAGKSAVVSAESGIMSFDDFIAKTAEDDDRTKAQKAMDWMFTIQEKILADMHRETGTLDTRLDRRLMNVIKKKDARQEFTSAYANKPPDMARFTKTIEQTPMEDRYLLIAEMKNDAETLLSAHERPAFMMELVRLQNKVALEMSAQEKEVTPSSEEMSMNELAVQDKRQKEKNLIEKFLGDQVAEKGMGTQDRSWWDNFLGKGMAETFSKGDR